MSLNKFKPGLDDFGKDCDLYKQRNILLDEDIEQYIPAIGLFI